MTDSRTVLLSAAAEEFAVHGLRGTRVQAIVKRAGVNERMIYHHFGSKEGLYTAAVQEQLRNLVHAWWPLMEDAATLDPYNGMRKILSGFFTVVNAHPLLVSLWLHEALSGWPTGPRPTVDTLPAPIRKVYERGQQDGTFRADCPFEIAYLTAFSSILGLIVFAGRGTELRKQKPELFGEGFQERVVGVLVDGMTGPSRSPSH